MRRSGFTLVEMLIAATLAMVILLTMTMAFGQMLRFWHRVAVSCERVQIGSIVLERICRDIRAAASIEKHLGMPEIGLLIAGEKVSYSWQGGKVKKNKGKQGAYLTNSGEINHFIFSYPDENLVEINLGGVIMRVAPRNKT